MRLIDADTLRKEVEKDRDASDMTKMWFQGVEYAINHIIHAPTVDPIKHGHWVYVGHGLAGESICKCSICGHQTPDDGNYCSYCGAKMDEAETDE